MRTVGIFLKQLDNDNLTFIGSVTEEDNVIYEVVTEVINNNEIIKDLLNTGKYSTEVQLIEL